MKTFHTLSFGILALALLLGCNRSDKPQPWEATPLQESIAADSPEPQLPPGHPATTSGEAPTSPQQQSGSLPPGHPPVDSSADTAAKPGAASGQVDVSDMHWTAPKSWVAKEPSSQIVSAEFKLPRAEGDTADGRLTVSLVNGTVGLNVKRWRDQFGGKPDKESTDSLDIAGIKSTLVDLAGTFHDGGGPMMAAAASVERPGYRMLATITPRNDTLVVIKAYGPAKTMAARADEVKAFVKSMKIDK